MLEIQVKCHFLIRTRVPKGQSWETNLGKWQVFYSESALQRMTVGKFVIHMCNKRREEKIFMLAMFMRAKDRNNPRAHQ